MVKFSAMIASDLTGTFKETRLKHLKLSLLFYEIEKGLPPAFP
jgi:hypothetical protein